MHNFKPQVGKYNMVLYEVEWVADNMNAILAGTINKTKGKLSKSLTDGHFSLCKLTHFQLSPDSSIGDLVTHSPTTTHC